MTIVPLIRQVVQERFGPFFDSIEGFFLKNFLILIQGLLTNSYTSISAIAADEHYGVSHTTLFRFLQSHEEFWATMKNSCSRSSEDRWWGKAQANTATFWSSTTLRSLAEGS